jgi:murein DD-endopeptidase MepM/ murein hydrolase activator NlpD
MSRRTGIGLALATSALCLAAQAGAGGAADTRPTVRASAYGVKILLPNQPPLVGGAVAGPPSSRLPAGSFAFPEDGSIVRVASITGRTATHGLRAAARADLRNVSLFGGEITADAVVARSESSAATDGGAVDFGATAVANLVVLGQLVQPSTNLRVPLADWGHAILLQQRERPDEPGGPIAQRGWVTVLDVWLDADHAGLPVGTRILVGYAESAARATAADSHVEQSRSQTPPPGRRTGPPVRPRITRGLGIPPEQPRPGTKGPSPLVLLPEAAGVRLTSDGYVFPVHGPAGFGDTFGAPRAVVEWHHGADIFAPLGAPVLAVADGTLFSVGRNDLGGNRLWLRDGKGNEFYYAHLSAFSPLAVNGARVAAGDVIGFVGNTGDADGTQYHLHFEIHPASLLFLGYEGAVNPTRYLRAWQHLEDIDFPSAAVWAPTLVATGRAPEPGAILLQSSDISTTSGLDPGSLADALGSTRTSVEGALDGVRPRAPARGSRP